MSLKNLFKNNFWSKVYFKYVKNINYYCVLVAQMVERQTVDLSVTGSKQVFRIFSNRQISFSDDERKKKKKKEKQN